MKRFKNVLLVSEKGAVSKAILNRAVSLARRNGARLTVVDVIEQLAQDMRMFGTVMTPQELEQAVIKERQDALNRLIEPVREDGVETNVSILTGTPFIEIIRKVLGSKHDLVIVKAEGVGGLKGRLFGNAPPVREAKFSPMPRSASWPLHSASQPLPALPALNLPVHQQAKRADVVLQNMLTDPF